MVFFLGWIRGFIRVSDQFFSRFYPDPNITYNKT